MIRKILMLVLMFAFAANAQTKKPTAKVAAAPAKTVTETPEEPEEPIDPMEALENSLPLEVELDPMTGKKIFHPERKRVNDSLRAALRTELKKQRTVFWVKTMRPEKGKKGQVQLCMNISNGDTSLVYCTNDSILTDPEVYKVLYEKQKGDTMFMLIHVDAFNKTRNDGLCNSGHEVRLFFTRWNTKTNKAIWKSKNIASCAKGITNMSKNAIAEWNKSTPLIIKYNRSLNFYEIKFDPNRPELGIQSLNQAEGKKGDPKKED
jgi:hypothetical protein